MSSSGTAVVTVTSSANELATAYNSQQKLATAPDGSLFVVYTMELDNGSYVVQVSRSTDGGESWTALPSDPSVVNSSRASIAVDAKGVVHLVWAEGIPSYTKSKTFTTQIYYSTFDGVSWSPKVKLSESRWYSGFPSIAIDSQGRINVVWYGYDGVFYQIFYTFYNGTAWSKPLNISNLSEDSVNPAILAGDNGRLYAVWYAQVSRYFQVWYSEYNGTWSFPKALTSDPRDDLNPSAIIGPSGQLSVVWDSAVSGVVQVFHIAFNGIAWSPVGQLTHLNSSSSPPTQAFAANGSQYVFWASQGGIYGCVYTKTCAPFVVYSEGTNSYPYASTGGSSSSGLNLVWTSLAGGRTSVLFESLPISTPSGTNLGAFETLAVVAVVTAIYIAYFIRRRGASASGKG